MKVIACALEPVQVMANLVFEAQFSLYHSGMSTNSGSVTANNDMLFVC